MSQCVPLRGKNRLRPTIVKVPPPPLPIEPAVRFGTWAQVYGDYQKRDAAGPALLNCCIISPSGDPALNGPAQLALKIESRTGTVGFVAGADLTSRGLSFANDGFIAGVTVGSHIVRAEAERCRYLTITQHPQRRIGSVRA